MPRNRLRSLYPQYQRTNGRSNTKGRDATQFFQPKAKETMAVKLSGAAQPKQKGSTSGSYEFKFMSKVYSFKDEQVATIFHLLHKGNKLKLLEVRRPNKVGSTNDANYCLFHRIVHHPTSKCFILEDKIQALVDARVLTLMSKQKKVTANMVTLNFGTFSKIIIQVGATPVPKVRLDVFNPMVEVQKAKGLVPIMTKSREIMWVHPDIVEGQQLTTVTNRKSKGKEKAPSCNVVCASSR